MSISEKEVYEDFQRFIRHEAMRANISQIEVLTIIDNMTTKELLQLKL